jgi:two-component system sensor histidine kinase HupT/HoxJ
LPADLPPVLGRGIALEQVIMNLIGNACDAYRDNPASEPDQPRLIGMRARQDGNLIHLSVWDRAGGIQSGALEYIFQPFFTTKPIGQGTGLGLSVSYGIITDHGGTIEAHNQDGGAWFEIRLPVAIAA